MGPRNEGLGADRRRLLNRTMTPIRSSQYGVVVLERTCGSLRLADGQPVLVRAK